MALTQWRVFTTSTVTNEILADLPFAHLSFTRPVNSAGRAQISIPLNDPRLEKLDVLGATQRLRTTLWVEYAGVLLFGGFVTQRRYTRSTQILQVTANSFSWYFSHRLQAKDYSFTFLAPTDPMAIATTLAGDAMSVQNSALNRNAPTNVGIPWVIDQVGVTPLTNWVSMSYPMIQIQTLQMMIQTLTEMGYGVGFDYADSAAYDANHNPYGIWTIANPYVGRSPQETKLVLDWAQSIEGIVSEDGSRTANHLVELSTAAGSVMVFGTNAPSQIEYLLHERLEMHPDINSTPIVQLVLESLAQSDLVLHAFGLDKLEVTLPAELANQPTGSSFSVRDFAPGDGVTVSYLLPPTDISKNDPRFPHGYTGFWRIIDTDVRVPSEGVATMKLTLNVLPMDQPQPSGLN